MAKVWAEMQRALSLWVNGLFSFFSLYTEIQEKAEDIAQNDSELALMACVWGGDSACRMRFALGASYWAIVGS